MYGYEVKIFENLNSKNPINATEITEIDEISNAIAYLETITDDTLEIGISVDFYDKNGCIKHLNAQDAIWFLLDVLKSNDDIRLVTVRIYMDYTVNPIIESVEKSLQVQMKASAKFQLKNKPTGNVFNPCAKFRKNHLSANITYRKDVENE